MYKRLFFLLILISFGGKVSAQNTGIDRRAQAAINGNWTIDSISFPESESSQISSFYLADSKCFEGSIWKFNASDDSGQMAIKSQQCKTFSLSLQWSVNKDQQFSLKFLNASQIDNRVKEEYILKLGTQTRDSFELIDKVEIDGKTTNVIYTFKKAD